MKNYAIIQYLMSSFTKKILDQNVPNFKEPQLIEDSAKELALELSYHATKEEITDVLGDLLDLFVNYCKNETRDISVMRRLTTATLFNYSI